MNRIEEELLNWEHLIDHSDSDGPYGRTYWYWRASSGEKKHNWDPLNNYFDCLYLIEELRKKGFYIILESRLSGWFLKSKLFTKPVSFQDIPETVYRIIEERSSEIKKCLKDNHELPI